ncbi:TPA: DUF1841 family protein [Legionella pneumophila]
MFYGDTVQETRQLFFISWNKYQNKKELSPLEKEIAQVILDHPEYHKVIEQSQSFLEHTYYPELGETNPFLHMGLHLAVREQIATDRPQGIRTIYTKLIEKYQDPLAVEHLIMDQLAECLWLSQKNNSPPDENNYLITLQNL